MNGEKIVKYALIGVGAYIAFKVITSLLSVAISLTINILIIVLIIAAIGYFIKRR